MRVDGQEDAEDDEQAVAGEGAASMEATNYEAAADGEAASGGNEDDMEAALVDDEWVQMPGGPAGLRA